MKSCIKLEISDKYCPGDVDAADHRLETIRYLIHNWLNGWPLDGNKSDRLCVDEIEAELHEDTLAEIAEQEAEEAKAAAEDMAMAHRQHEGDLL